MCVCLCDVDTAYHLVLGFSLFLSFALCELYYSYSSNGFNKDLISNTALVFCSTLIFVLCFEKIFFSLSAINKQ